MTGIIYTECLGRHEWSIYENAYIVLCSITSKVVCTLTLIVFTNMYFTQWYPLQKFSTDAGLPPDISDQCKNRSTAPGCDVYSRILSDVAQISNINSTITGTVLIRHGWTPGG